MSAKIQRKMRYYHISAIFRVFLFGGKDKFIIFAGGKSLNRLNLRLCKVIDI